MIVFGLPSFLQFHSVLFVGCGSNPDCIGLCDDAYCASSIETRRQQQSNQQFFETSSYQAKNVLDAMTIE